MNDIITYMVSIGIICFIIANIGAITGIETIFNRFITLAGILIISSILLLGFKIHSNKLFKPQYKIDLISKDSVKIDNGEIIKTIHLNNIENYIKNDTINN